jgi:hypothetical protein
MSSDRPGWTVGGFIRANLWQLLCAALVVAAGADRVVRGVDDLVERVDRLEIIQQQERQRLEPVFYLRAIGESQAVETNRRLGAIEAKVDRLLERAADQVGR